MTFVPPPVTPRFAAPRVDVPWPSDEWPASTRRLARLDAVVDEMFTLEELATTNAVVVVQGGCIVAERYGGVRTFFDRPDEPVTSGTALLSWSMAKSMLHFLVGTLVDEHRLNPADRAHVAQWDDEHDPRHAITLGDLLAMRDGLDFVEEYDIDRPSDVIEMLFGAGRSDVATYAAQRSLAHEPGTHFSYSSGTSNILSRIVADVVGYGDDYRNYLTQRLFDPLGMRSAHATFDDAGVFIASSYVHASATDFAKFGLLYLRGGEWEGRQLISREWASSAQVPRSRDDESGAYYSWQWWVSNDRYGTYWASGYEGQMICVVPALDAVIVRLGHSAAHNYPAIYQWRQRVLNVLRDPYAPS